MNTSGIIANVGAAIALANCIFAPRLPHAS